MNELKELRASMKSRRAFQKKKRFTTPGGGSLGSQIDEERSQLREARRIAGLHETVNGRTHIAALAHGSGPHPPEGHLNIITSQIVGFVPSNEVIVHWLKSLCTGNKAPLRC
jgi:hypothetical protein